MHIDTPRNWRMALLEDAADTTARTLVRRPDIRVVVGPMPAYDWKNKILTVPSYQQEPDEPFLRDSWRGLVDHECAHVELTDFDALDRALARWKAEGPPGKRDRLMALSNAMEDVWIEPVFARIWPGTAEHFRAKNQHLIKITGGGAPTNPLHVPEGGTEPLGVWGAFTQAVVRLGRGSISMTDVHPATQPLIELVLSSLKKGWSAANTQQVIDAADEVWAVLQDLVPPMEEEPEIEGLAGGGGSGAEGEEAGTVVAGGSEEGAGEEGGEPCPGGAGNGPVMPQVALVAAAIGGAWGAVQADQEVIAQHYLDKIRGEYTVHPGSRALDKVIRYGRQQRASGELQRQMLDESSGQAGAKLRSYLRAAVQAARLDRTVGGMEEGEDLDEAALPDIALRTGARGIFTRRFTQVTESTYIAILVDCSGSMGHSDSVVRCPTHGLMSGTQRTCPKCGGALTRTVQTKAGYAAQTAYAAHRALSDLRIHHCVLGYSTVPGLGGPNPRRQDGRLTWSRMSRALEMHVFVESPGVYDRGDALPYITGRDCNLDGESVLWAARYAAKHGGDKDRVIQLVIADGLPAGADDEHLEGVFLQQAVERVAHCGIEVYGVACAVPKQHLSVFRKYYPDNPGSRGRAPTGSVHLPSGEGLSDAVIQQLADLLTRGLTAKAGK